jgi:hypothetical protein
LDYGDPRSKRGKKLVIPQRPFHISLLVGGALTASGLALLPVVLLVGSERGPLTVLVALIRILLPMGVIGIFHGIIGLIYREKLILCQDRIQLLRRGQLVGEVAYTNIIKVEQDEIIKSKDHRIPILGLALLEPRPSRHSFWPKTHKSYDYDIVIYNRYTRSLSSLRKELRQRIQKVHHYLDKGL